MHMCAYPRTNDGLCVQRAQDAFNALIDCRVYGDIHRLGGRSPTLASVAGVADGGTRAHAAESRTCTCRHMGCDCGRFQGTFGSPHVTTNFGWICVWRAVRDRRFYGLYSWIRRGWDATGGGIGDNDDYRVELGNITKFVTSWLLN
jgi:hypothetical protein